jgi:hypothetical protein
MSKARHRNELQRARAKRLAQHLEQIRQRQRASTTEWVDESYAKRLAAQLCTAVRTGKLHKQLRAMRESPLYITEFATAKGFDVWYFDWPINASLHSPVVANVLPVVHIAYTAEGGAV